MTSYDEAMSQLYAPKDPSSPIHGSIEDNGPGMTCDVYSGKTIVDNGSHSYDVWDEQQKAKESGAHYLDTGRTASGTPIRGRGNLTDDSIVTLPDGTEARVKDLVTVGILQANPDGTYSEAPRHSPSQKSEVSEQGDSDQSEQPEYFSDDTEDTINAIGRMVDQSTIWGALNRIAAGEDIDNYLGRAASQVGKEPGEMAEIINGLRSQFEGQAYKVVSDMGLDPQQCFEWVRNNKPRELHQAIMDHAVKRTTSGYKQLAGEFLADMDKMNPDAILNADLGEGILEARKVGNEVVLKTATMGEIPWKAAVKMGLLKVGRR